MRGCLTISEIRSHNQPIPLQYAVDSGLVVPSRTPRGWGIGRDEISLGQNLVVDTGRQAGCYALGGLTPSANNVITNFGAGTGLTVPQATDVQLVSPLPFSTGSLYQAVDSVAFPAPFNLQVKITIDAASMNGYLLTEFGLFTGNNTLIARKLIQSGINKGAGGFDGLSYTLLWRIRV